MVDYLNYIEIATKYAENVINGKISSSEITKASCRRHLSDLKNKDLEFHFDNEKASRACKFIELLPHVKGALARKKELIKLEPWQIFIISSIFGWVDKNGLRRYRTSYIEVARKNAKSTLASGVALYMLTADNEAGAEVYSCATTRDQARIVFDDSKKMCEKTRGMRNRFGIKVLAHSIEVKSSNSIFRSLSRDTGGNLDGLNTHCAIIDELHAHKTRDLFDVIDTSTGARDQSLIFMITTAGFDQSGICYEKREYTRRVVTDEIKDERWFGIIYTVDDEVKEQDETLLTDKEMWKMANPNFNISVSEDDLSRKATQALATPSARANFYTKHLNVWTRSAAGWLDLVAWDKCTDTTLNIKDYEKEECWIAADLANKRDIASVAIVFRDKEKNGFVAFVKHYINEAASSDSKNAAYAGWVSEKRIIVTTGNVTDYSVIENDIREMSEYYNVNTIALDPWQAEQMRQRLADIGINAVELKQSKSYISPSAKILDELILQQKIRLEPCPVLRWMAGNVVVKPDALDHIFPLKSRVENKIDGIVALIMSIGIATTDDSYSLDGSEITIL